MNVEDEDLGNGIHTIKLAGRMDIAGVGLIETRLAGLCAPPRQALVLDLSEVGFMSSIGLRALLINAKAVGRRGGKVVLLSPQAPVRGVLESAGIDALIPICDTIDDARARVSG